MTTFKSLLALSFLLVTVATGQPADFLQKTVTQYELSDTNVPPALREPASTSAWTHWDKGPVEGLKEYATTRNGIVWLGSDRGAARFDPQATHLWDRWQYFAGKRWLPDDEIQHIYVDPEGSHETVWIRTRLGVSRIAWEPMTFAQKERHFDALTEQHHIRKGFVARSLLTEAGNPSSSANSDTDNDGLWTAMYLATQAYRYAVTADDDARIKARRSLDALMRLETIDPIPGFYARTYRTFDEPFPHQDNGQWHPVGDDKTEWKGDTSSDETVGHYYGYAMYYDLVADEAEKEEIRTYIRRITDYMIDNDYELLDVDGEPTRWGRWSEAYFDTGEGDYEKALRALELLSFLKTAYHITGDQKYQEAYLDRVRRGYAQFTLEYRRWGSTEWEINYSDDELYYLSVYPLMKYEDDPALHAIYMDGLRFTWSQVQPESNALWNYMSAALGAGPLTDMLAADSRRSLVRAPLGLIHWETKNSHRIDVRMNRSPDRHNRDFLVRVLAPDERRIHKHNGNPYQADGGGNGTQMMEPTFWLLPYWMARYYSYPLKQFVVIPSQIGNP